MPHINLQTGKVECTCLKCQRRFTMTSSEFLHSKKRDAMYCPKCRKEVGK